MPRANTLRQYLGASYAAHGGPRSIASVYGLATPQERADGATWYQRAHRFACKLGAYSGIGTDRSAAILARLSPQVSWDDNRAAAFEIATHADQFGAYEIAPRCYGRNIVLAELIRDGLPIKFNPQTGPKITAFYSNIRKPKKSLAVTIDSWAIRVWLADILAPQLKITPAQYRRLATDYRIAADRIGCLPHVLQATTWIVAHRLRARTITPGAYPREKG